MVPVARAQQIYRQACQGLSGYERPKLILDLPEAVGKVGMEAPGARLSDDGGIEYLSAEGRWEASERNDGAIIARSYAF
jgi:L-lysine 2,3-aminomutase